MSHEFRTPIASIRSLARLLLDRVDGPLTERAGKAGALHPSRPPTEFAEMVDDLLDLAKVEAGRVEISPDWFEMVDLFSALRGMFKPMLTNPDVALVFEEPPGQPAALHRRPEAVADPAQLHLQRAEVHDRRARCASRRTQNGETSVTFAVADTGIGIAQEYHHAIFHDFAQIDSPIQKRLRGTGLGLSLSKRLAELLGGTVALESELGTGSTFSVTLPLHVPQAEPGTQGEAMDEAPTTLPPDRPVAARTAGRRRRPGEPLRDGARCCVAPGSGPARPRPAPKR